MVSSHTCPRRFAFLGIKNTIFSPLLFLSLKEKLKKRLSKV
jgi:hypothetical protein